MSNYSPHPEPSFQSHPQPHPHTQPQRYRYYPDEDSRTPAFFEGQPEPASIRRYDESSASSTLVVPDNAIMVVRNNDSLAYDSYNVNSAPAAHAQPSMLVVRDSYHDSGDNYSGGYSSSPGFPEQPPPPPRYYRGRPVKPKNQHLPDHILDFKERRKLRTAAATWTGGVVGLVSMGPVGAALGATAAYGIAKGVGKARERRLVAKSNVHVPTGSEGTTTNAPNALLHNAVLA